MAHLISGSIATVLGLYGIFSWWDDFGHILRGLGPFVVFIVGFLAIGASVTQNVRFPDNRDEGQASAQTDH